MNRSITTITFSLLLLVSCNRGYTDSFVSDVNIDLTQEDCKPVESRIENISVVEFAIDDSWRYVSVPLMTKTDSSFVLCDANYYHFLIYDMNGKKKTDRHIKGRGRGEVLGINTLFLNDESICIYDGGMGSLLFCVGFRLRLYYFVWDFVCVVLFCTGFCLCPYCFAQGFYHFHHSLCNYYILFRRSGIGVCSGILIG